ncbi:MAG: ComF family protein [Betaproteobacteria bacterium]
MQLTRWFGPATARRFALPTRCAVCRAWDDARLCRDCVARFVTARSRCRRCAIDVPAGVTTCGTCLRQPPTFDRTIAAVSYDHPWDGLVAAFKFHAALDLAPVLAERIVQAVRAAGETPPDLVLPVPLGATRLRERGYNQAWELARRVARRQRRPADAALLARVRETPHQLALPRAARAANVRGAFLVEPRRAHELRGREVALVDDVLTTGATAGEIATVLRRAGAARVQLWVLARTPAD